MKDRSLVLALLSCIAGLLVGNDAAANGINPPRLMDATTITASCDERSGTRRHEIFRARIAAADSALATLTLRLGDASEQVAIAKIESLELTDGVVDREGFTRATLTRRDDARKEPAAVQVRAKDAPLRLSGFNSSRSRIDIELAKCRTIEFSLAGANDGARQPAPAAKKH